MAIDPNIALGVRPIEIANPLAQYGQVAQLQAVQTQNQLHQMQMREAEAMAQERNALRQLNPSSSDYEQQLFKVNPQLGIAYRKEANTAAAQEATRQKALVEAAASKQKLLSQALRDISSRPSDANIMAHTEDIQASDLFTPAEKQKALATQQTLLRLPFEERTKFLSSQGATAGEMKPHFVTENLGGTSRVSAIPAFGGAPSTVSEAPVTMTEAQIKQDKRDRERIALEGQRVGLEGQRVAILREQEARNKDPVFQQTMAAAKATGEAIAKGDVAAKQALPTILSRASETLQLVDQMVGKQEVRDKSGKIVQAATTPHPGFENAVGFGLGQRFIPGTDAAGFTALFDQVKGGAFLEAFQALKGAGAITEKEGEKGTGALTRMSLAQNEKEFVAAAREFQDVVRTGVQNAQKKANLGGTAAPAAPASNIDALLKKYP